MDRRSWLLILTLASIWGASYMLIKIGLRDLSPSMIAWARIALAALVLVPLAASRGGFGALAGEAGLITLVGAVQVAGPFLLIAAGEQEITSSLTGVLVASAPLFTALLAVWVDQEERSEGTRLAGALLGLVGVAVLLGLDLGSGGSALLGGFAVVLAGLGYALGGFVVKHRFRDAEPIVVAAAVMVASTVLLAPAAALSAPASLPGLGPVAAVVLLGAVGTGVAFAIFYRLLTTVGPARTFIVIYLVPAFAIAYGVLLLGESISVATVSGTLLIAAGSWLAAGGGIGPLGNARPSEPSLRTRAWPSRS